ncbi:MAG: hypothetical protein WAL89_14345 [Candidatus Sulfotelmatobacter sp.]|jgi:hypothetical protein
MRQHFVTSITYFLQEGRDNLPECLKIAFRAAKQQSVDKIVVFTARGQGIQLALNTFCSQDEYRNIKLVAVTFPQAKAFSSEGKPIEVRISDEADLAMKEHNIPLVRAHLPFDPIAPPFADRGVLAQDLGLVESALNIFGGGMSLCVQAVVLACDAGAIGPGEHVIAMTSDTAILVQASPTARMLRELVIREILCKPAILSIGRNENQVEGSIPHRVLGAGEPESAKILPEKTPDQL